MNPPLPLAPGALTGLRVLDLTRVLAGPYCTMILGDFGAEIIKVEQPGRGDETRQWGPPFNAAGESAYYLAVNRNKRSLTLDLKQEAGREILHALACRADVLVENFKVGTMARLGLGYERLRADNRGLIYCALTGYGQEGDARAQPGYDTVIQAQGGLMSITGPTDGAPTKVGVALVDVMAGLYASTSILAALRHRDATGEGQFVDIALFDTQLGALVNVASGYLVSGERPQRYGNGHATIVPYQPFPTADGWLMVAVGNDRQFAALCRALGEPALAADERFATNPARVANRAALLPLLEAHLRADTTADWTAALGAAGVPCGPVNDIPTALADPQAQARGMVQSVEHPAYGAVPQVGPVPKLSATPPRIASAPPRLGEHSEEILREVLGYDEARIAELRGAGVV